MALINFMSGRVWYNETGFVSLKLRINSKPYEDKTCLSRFYTAVRC